MNKDRKKQLEQLNEVAKKGVVIYHREKPVTPLDVVRETFDYRPEFIVYDENGKLKEIWY